MNIDIDKAYIALIVALLSMRGVISGVITLLQLKKTIITTTAIEREMLMAQ